MTVIVTPPPTTLAPPPATGLRFTLTCEESGVVHYLDYIPTFAQRRELCGVADTTTVPKPRLPKIQRTVWRNPDGSSAVASCTIPPDDTWRTKMPSVNWCPPPGPRQYRWTATYDNGEVLTGITPMIPVGDEWRLRPNDWNGWITITRGADGSTGFLTSWN
jgi:hypothetical protein